MIDQVISTPFSCLSGGLDLCAGPAHRGFMEPFRVWKESWRTANDFLVGEMADTIDNAEQ